MKFEQFPPEPSEEPAKRPRRKGLAILGLIGALAGGTEAAQADTGATERNAAEKESKDAARLKDASDKYWESEMKVQERHEAKGPDGRTVLTYEGKRTVNNPDDTWIMKGYSVLDEGDPKKSGDERTIHLTYERDEGTGDSFLQIMPSDEASEALLMENPISDELAKAGVTDVDGAGLSLDEMRAAGASSWWWAYALNVAGESDARILRKAGYAEKDLQKDLETDEAADMPSWMVGMRNASKKMGLDLDPVKERIKEKFEVLYKFQPKVKKR